MQVSEARRPCYHTPPMRLARADRGTLVVFARSSLTVRSTYPVAFHIDRIGRVNTDDGRWSIWVVSWVAHALTTDPLQRLSTPTSSIRIATPWPSRRPISAQARSARRCGQPTKNPYTTHNVVFLLSFVHRVQPAPTI